MAQAMDCAGTALAAQTRFAAPSEGLPFGRESNRGLYSERRGVVAGPGGQLKGALHVAIASSANNSGLDVLKGVEGIMHLDPSTAVWKAKAGVYLFPSLHPVHLRLGRRRTN